MTAARVSNRNNLPGASADKALTPRNFIKWQQALWGKAEGPRSFTFSQRELISLSFTGARKGKGGVAR